MRTRDAHGFTLIELLIVIVVIAVISTVTIVAYGGVQREARDNERKTDIAAIQRNLEIFHSKNGSYPGIGQLQNLSGAEYGSGSFVPDNLPDLSKTYLTAPDAPSSVTNSIIGDGGTPAVNPETYQYQYLAQHANGDWCGATSEGNECVKFTLRWKSEADDSIVELKSEHYPDDVV